MTIYNFIILHTYLVYLGAWGSILVKALRYSSDGPGINPRWCHWGFFPWFLPTKPCALRSNQPLKISTRGFSWGKGGRCVWLTTYHPCSVASRDDRGLNLPGTPRATSACRGITFISYTSWARNKLDTYFVSIHYTFYFSDCCVNRDTFANRKIQ